MEAILLLYSHLRIGIGVLSWFTFASVDQPIGITTAFEYTTAPEQQDAAEHDG